MDPRPPSPALPHMQEGKKGQWEPGGQCTCRHGTTHSLLILSSWVQTWAPGQAGVQQANSLDMWLVLTEFPVLSHGRVGLGGVTQGCPLGCASVAPGGAA